MKRWSVILAVLLLLLMAAMLLVPSLLGALQGGHP
jgi:hypothetical protein